MKEKWDIPVEEYDASEDKSDDALVFEVGGMVAAVSLAACPIPGGEAEANAENNYMWEDAVKAAREHRAHIMVAVLGKEEDVLEKGKLYTKLVAACCRQKYATGIYTSGVVFEPRFYEGFADMMREDELPIFNWIWFGLWQLGTLLLPNANEDGREHRQACRNRRPYGLRQNGITLYRITE